MNAFRKTLSLMLAVVFLPGICFAGSDWTALPTFEDLQAYGAQYRFEASASSDASSPEAGSRLRLNVGFLHKVFAYGTLALACVAGATGSDSATHHNSAVAASALGLMTVATGYYEYGDMFDMDEGFSQPNLHIVLGTIGALGFATEAVIASTDSGHGGLGIGSAIAMGAATVIIYW